MGQDDSQRLDAMPPGLSRREVLRRGGLAVGALTLPGLLAACGEKEASTGAAVAGTNAAAGKALKPFDPKAAAGAKSNLPKRFGFPAAFTDPVSEVTSKAMRESIESVGFEYTTATTTGELTKSVAQIESTLTQGVAGMFLYPINEKPTRPLAQRALDQGVCIFGGGGRPYSTVQLAESSVTIGRQQGQLAAKWIREKLGGKAKVVYFNEDSSQTLIPRHKTAIAEIKKAGPGVEIVSDIEVKFDIEAGSQAFATILQAHPDVNVVLGPQAVIAGVYAVLESKGKAKDPKIFVSSLAGSADDLKKIAAGDNVYKATFAYPFPVYGWGIGQFTADWQAGRSIPRLMTTPNGGTIEISSPELVQQFTADMADPRGTWEDTAKRDRYVRLLGNIRWEDRDQYWRAEAELPA
jgi:ribose transport system substrate-binding protein